MQNKSERQVIINMGGILPFHEAFYIESLRYCVEQAQNAFKQFDDMKFSTNHFQIVGKAQEAITHVAALSRFFWLSGSATNSPLHKARAEKLRQSFSLDDTSLLNDRTLRNAIEHFDERLDNFLSSNPSGLFFLDAKVGSIESIGEVDQVFRFIDPDKDIFILLGAKYDIRPLRYAVEDISTKISKMHGGRLHIH